MNPTGEPLPSPHDPGLLAAYVENRLDEHERQAMTLHLASCGDCRRVLAMLARADGAVPSANPRPASPRVWLAVAAAVILATVAVRRVEEPRPGRASDLREPAEVTGPVAPSPTVAATPVTEPEPPTRVAAADPLRDSGLLVKRGGAQRRAGNKSFRLTGGAWVDSAFDRTAALPSVDVDDPVERARILAEVPGLAPYAAVAERVVVVFEGTVYRFNPGGNE